MKGRVEQLTTNVQTLEEQLSNLKEQVLDWKRKMKDLQALKKGSTMETAKTGLETTRRDRSSQGPHTRKRDSSHEAPRRGAVQGKLQKRTSNTQKATKPRRNYTMRETLN